jgi:hypothetical protein
MDLLSSIKESELDVPALFKKGDRVLYTYSPSGDQVECQVIDNDYYANVKGIVPDGPVLMHLRVLPHNSKGMLERYGRYVLAYQDEVQLL